MSAIFRRRIFAAFLALTVCWSTAFASEMYLIAQNYNQAPNSEQAISLINGTFEKSTNAVEASRLQDVQIIMGETVVKPSDQQWTTDETFSYLRYSTGGEGTYVVGALTKPRVIDFTPKQFAAYLAQLGKTEMLSGFSVDNRLEPIRERYSKQARALIQVGDDRTSTYQESLGYPIEIILDKNPYSLRFGEEIGFQVLEGGKPISDQVATASCDGFHGHDASGGHISSIQLRTDREGRAKFLISQKCIWYISLTYLQKVDDADAEYESSWATVTFEVN